MYPPVGLYSRMNQGYLAVKFGGNLPDADTTIDLDRGSFFRTRKLSANRDYTLPDPGNSSPYSIVIECLTPVVGFAATILNGGGTPGTLTILSYAHGHCFVWNDPDWEYTGFYKLQL